MARSRRKQGCARCARLEAQVAALAARVAALEAELAKAKKHSGNSSKPPSGDIVNPVQNKKRGRRKGNIGGQPGHERHEREPFAREELDQEWLWYYSECPCCGGRLTQGTRSHDGRRWCERIWTVIQTCGQRQRSVFDFLVAAVTAHFRCDPAPSLAPATS